MVDNIARCALCGEPMPTGEEMFKYHGYSGNCPKPSLPKPVWKGSTIVRTKEELEAALLQLESLPLPSVIKTEGYVEITHRPGWEPCTDPACDYNYEKMGRSCFRCGKLMVDFGD